MTHLEEERAQAVSRRTFLGRAGSATAALGLAGCLHRADRETSVLVIGGGLAGVRTLDLLRGAGRKAHLLEGADILGGRIRTVRAGLTDGEGLELGAERVPDGCPHLQALVRELGLQTRDYPRSQGAFVLRIDGQTHLYREPSDLPATLRFALHPRERDQWPFLLHFTYCDAASEVVPDDPRSGLQWLRDQGASALGIRFIRAFFPEPIDRMSAFGFWSAAVRFRRAGVSRTLVGGLDQLVHRLADRHRDHITTGVDVASVTVREGEIEATDAGGGVWRAQDVVLALPLVPLKRLRFLPRRPALVDAWVNGREVGREVRIHVDYEEAELRRKDLNTTFAGLDFPRVTWASPVRTGPQRRVLSTVSFHDEIDLVRGVVASQGPAGLRSLLCERIPQVTTFGRRVWTADLNADPRIGGTFPYATPGAPATPTRVREGPLILAGGDFSSWPGSMEGALASAVRAAAEVGGG